MNVPAPFRHVIRTYAGQLQTQFGEGKRTKQ
jgi:hypothetical protein